MKTRADFAVLPTHIAIIMDGNGRWATARGLTRSDGHKAGAETVRRAVSRCRELGIQYLTLYAFSQENWSRPKMEVNFLFELLTQFIRNELPLMMRENVRLCVLGDIDALPLAARAALKLSMQKTQKNDGLVLNLALNYSGRAELVHACRKIVAEGIAPQSITDETIAAHLWSAGQPDPDLIIRTSGEVRLSNFLLFQCAYSELYFTKTPWPDFDATALDDALEDFALRQRRFGNTEPSTTAGKE